MSKICPKTLGPPDSHGRQELQEPQHQEEPQEEQLSTLQQAQYQEWYMSWMLWYIQNNDLSGLQMLLATHGFHDFVTPQGLRPAHLAARCQLPEVLSVLVGVGASVNEYSPSSSSVLQLAMQGYPADQEASLSMARGLLQPLPSGGASPVTDRHILGEALQVAAGEGWARLVPLLLAAGAHPDYCSPADEFRMTPAVGMIFENQARPGHCAALRELLAAGMDLAHLSNQWTVVEYAQHYGRDDLLPLLLAAASR
mmetsp:Transcript_16268/g.30387  ORF Transcript_16268/g.30387 Transcript_16268/m.30387 type:complete len:254 (+) Transcript_16268:57-818(+)